MWQQLNGSLKMFVDELPLNGKVSVFVVTAPNAVGAVNRNALAAAASPKAIRLLTTRPPLLDGGETGCGGRHYSEGASVRQSHL